jgi:hypothetical protein
MKVLLTGLDKVRAKIGAVVWIRDPTRKSDWLENDGRACIDDPMWMEDPAAAAIHQPKASASGALGKDAPRRYYWCWRSSIYSGASRSRYRDHEAELTVLLTGLRGT